MGYFCKGIFLGMISGAIVGAVSVVKNKKVYNYVNETTKKAESKISKCADKISKKLSKKGESPCAHENEIGAESEEKYFNLSPS